MLVASVKSLACSLRSVRASSSFRAPQTEGPNEKKADLSEEIKKDELCRPFTKNKPTWWSSTSLRCSTHEPAEAENVHPEIFVPETVRRSLENAALTRNFLQLCCAWMCPKCPNASPKAILFAVAFRLVFSWVSSRAFKALGVAASRDLRKNSQDTN